LLRIKGWYAYFLIAVLGVIVSGGLQSQGINVVIFFMMISVYLGFSFAINDSFDAEVDQLNQSKNNPIATGEVEQSKAIFFSLILALSGVALSTWFGLTVFIFYLILVLLSLTYSAPPLRLKSRYPFDILSHGLYFGSFILLLPIFIFSSLNLELLLLAISIFWLSATIELHNHIRDYECDLKAGLRTTACVLGLENSEKIARILTALFPLTILPLLYSNTPLMFFISASLGYGLLFAQRNNPKVLYSYANVAYSFLCLSQGVILLSLIFSLFTFILDTLSSLLSYMLGCSVIRVKR
jgi:4-hydroxybenzoate polyprenyltransferase